jgi:hypothetical protein
MAVSNAIPNSRNSMRNVFMGLNVMAAEVLGELEHPVGLRAERPGGKQNPEDVEQGQSEYDKAEITADHP